MSKALDHVGAYYGFAVRHSFENDRAEVDLPGGVKSFTSDKPLAKNASKADVAAWKSATLKAIEAAKAAQRAGDAEQAAQVEAKRKQLTQQQQAPAPADKPEASEK